MFPKKLFIIAMLVLVAGVVNSPVTAIRAQGKEKALNITGAALKARLDKGQKVVILDSRSNLGPEIIKGAIHVPASEVENWAKTANKKAVIVSYCTCPNDESSNSQATKLRELGFHRAFSLTGGLEAARAAGIAIVPAAH
jgi:rhodanese-related sulfurtransferase